MHELSIAVAAISQIEEAAERHGADRVAVVRLRIGELSGVVPEALRFSFGIAAEGTRLAGARLEIETVEGRARCPVCGREAPTGVPPALWCAPCGAARDVLSGRELEIARVELDDTPVRDDTSVPDRARPADLTRKANHVPHR
ncbi:hydrogenase maturation nickel metallochaperone HypA [Streptomyces sp. NPDC047097]|uniref:hydrogenase maturation nickel metallochaperone HypA n=1 Tax=Streptomyces sp. NPDC047097 TaxID=3155260 RepID=UPI0034040055